MSVNQKQQEAERTVQKLVETLRMCAITIEKFSPPESQTVLFDLINKDLISSFVQLDVLRHAFDVEIPFQVLEYIDKAIHPEMYTHDLLEQCITKNEATKGKIEAFGYFGVALKEEIANTFPSEFLEYVKMKGNGLSQVMIKKQDDVKIDTEEGKNGEDMGGESNTLGFGDGIIMENGKKDNTNVKN